MSKWRGLGEEVVGTPLERRPIVLALVGTISPHPDLSDDLAIASAGLRRRQYLDNFARVLAHRSRYLSGVVFAENSGANLDDFHALADGRADVEVLSIPSPDVATGLGRGYLETLLVANVFEQSRIISDVSEPLVAKQTGRYHLRNMDSLLSRLDGKADLYLNLRRYPKQWADMWFYVATRRGMQALAGRLDSLREDLAAGLPSERSLFCVAVDLHKDDFPVRLRLPVEPHFAGLRAMDGVSYTSGRQEMKWVVRSVVKKVAPDLWI